MKLAKEKYRTLSLWGLLVIFSLGVSLWFVPGPSTPENLEQAENFPWSLLSLDKGRNLDDAFKTIRERSPWGWEASQDRNQQSNWRFCGVVRTQNKYVALIETDHEVRRYVQGDVLPGEEILRRIHNDHIEIQIRDDMRKVRLYEASWK